ncbi:hypothetical protein [Thalassospira australica]|uniref:hypothetical protein n=1 Tax=Thalassospira australica TaxID=1528106 RepID=UPI00051A8057|nr:hypothetical protein [Thalassospira australica]
MGIPKLYGTEIPARSLAILEGLYANVENNIAAEDGRGSLTVTFLLSMAMPMIIVPFERFKQKNDRANEFNTDKVVFVEFRRLMKKKVHEVDWIKSAEWAYFRNSSKEDKVVLVPEGLPLEVADRLNEPEANAIVAELTVNDVIKCFRHSLAHGNVAYLDANGQTSYDGEASYLAFVCDFENRRGSQVLRISIPAFREFLSCWGDWLRRRAVNL